MGADVEQPAPREEEGPQGGIRSAQRQAKYYQHCQQPEEDFAKQYKCSRNIKMK